MQPNDSFEFTYSAPEQEEIRRIREKYQRPAQRKTKLEQLRELDESVTRKGTVVSLLLSLESVFATLSGALLLHDRLSGREYFGCLLMLAAVLLSQLPDPKWLRRKEA